MLLTSLGCAVPQPRGEGHLQRVAEPSTNRSYYLYLPKDYVYADDAGRRARRWPLVVTFHGMKPYDIAYYQAREWEQEADRYGFIVVAPVLRAPVFIFGQFPQRTITPRFKSDELATLAILDHVFHTTRADPSNILSTSWSSGGYMAHYMLNRHPDRFTCLAVRQSNFSSSLLDSDSATRSLYHPILVVSTQNDIGICKRESRQAITWYESHGYKNLAWIYMSRLGHQRTPDTAADFFARVCGAAPNRPPQALTRRQAIDGNPTGLALLAGNLGSLEKPPGTEKAEPVSVVAAPKRTATPRQAVRPGAKTARRPIGVIRPGTPSGARARGARPRNRPPSDLGRAASPLGISVSSAVGFEPLLLVYSAECPTDWHRSAEFCWTLGGQDIGRGVNGQKTILLPGDYTLSVRVITRDGSEHRATRQIRVLRGVETSAPTPSRRGP